jgi:anti-sigma-K factor RskA
VNVQEYISSGIVESYVLGLASTEEKSEFEKLCREYPELVTARNNFELALERHMAGLSSAPDVRLKEKVMNAIRQLSSVNQTKLINMEQSSTTRRGGIARFVAAASVILLLGAAYFAYKFYSENKDLKESNEQLQTKIGTVDSTLRIMSDPNVAVVNLKGTEKAPKSSANIYWDSTAADVYLVVKNMPKLPSEQQYQLWAIINGQDGSLQPTSLGLFDVGDDGKIILKMSNADKADAFAITIENKGNTGGPNLEQLQSMGKARL